MDPLIAYTDGSALGNPGPGGWAYHSADGWAAGGLIRTTNNAMELSAILHLLKDTANVHPGRGVHIHTDSRYCLDALTKWVHGWRRRGWATAAGAPVANRDIIEEICELMRVVPTQFSWVRGHAGNPGNEAADAAATSFAKALQAGRAPNAGTGLCGLI